MRSLIHLASLVIALTIIPASFQNASLMTAPAAVKRSTKTPKQIHSSPGHNTYVPPHVAARAPARFPMSAAADTFVLHQEDFESDYGGPDRGGYVSVDMTEQLETYFHVADATELDGGESGHMLPLSGAQSMWCGVPASTAVPYCSYTTLPGYGNGWDQLLEAGPIPGDSLRLAYKVWWDSEPGYDGTTVEYSWNGDAWYSFPIDDSHSARALIYDGTAPAPYITEEVTSLIVPAAPVPDPWIRFRFYSDGSWSDQDGLWPTDGAIIVDDITVETWTDGVPAFSNFEDFESATPGSNTAGIWTGKTREPFGDFSALYPGVNLLQEDPCAFNALFLWAWITDPSSAYYTCSHPPHPEQGAMPWRIWDEFGMLALDNEIWSPPFDYSGVGSDVRLSFLVYRDMELDALQFYKWSVRSWVDGCPGPWRDYNFIYYGSPRDWYNTNFQIGPLIDPNADEIQVAVGAVDMCPVWCGIYHGGHCRSHAPLIDNIRVTRVNVVGPQFIMRHVDLFQDTFAEDGTVTGHARADAAIDILPSNSPSITPGDSVVITVNDPASALTTDPATGVGPSVYGYVAVRPNQSGKSGVDIEAPETRSIGRRYPLVDSLTHDGQTWYCFRLDTVRNYSGVVADKYCLDLNDAVFTPGDTICYFFGATNIGGASNYISRKYDGQGKSFTTADMTEALASAMEFTILPAGGWKRGGDILYVDDSGQTGGPLQLFYDWTFASMDALRLVDRYDVLAPSSRVGNSLASRVKNIATQIVGCYKNIIWSSGDYSRGLIGDGHNEKSDDFSLLYEFLDQHPGDPGLLLTGDNIADEWRYLPGVGTVNLRATYMNFNLADNDHTGGGEPISPLLTASGDNFPSLDDIIAYGGCPGIDKFDLLEATGASQVEFENSATGRAYVLSQSTPNNAGSTARVLLTGFSFNDIHQASPGTVARAGFLADAFTFFQNTYPVPTGVDPPLNLTNYMADNYPNPFNPTTTIRYGIRERAHVSVKIYNAAGQMVKTLVDEVQSPDQVKPVTWDGTNNAGQSVSSGVYFCRLVTKDFAKTRKMVVLR